MRSISRNHPALGNVLPSQDRLTAFRALPHLDVLPASASEAPGAEVRLLDDAINLPHGGYLTVSMVHSRLARPSMLRVDLLDRSGRQKPAHSLVMEPPHAALYAEAVQRFLAVAYVPGTATTLRSAVGC